MNNYEWAMSEPVIQMFHVYKTYPSKGEVIALVGDTDSIKGPHLYLEIRHQGKPQNPMRLVGYI